MKKGRIVSLVFPVLEATTSQIFLLDAKNAASFMGFLLFQFVFNLINCISYVLFKIIMSLSGNLFIE